MLTPTGLPLCGVVITDLLRVAPFAPFAPFSPGRSRYVRCPVTPLNDCFLFREWLERNSANGANGADSWLRAPRSWADLIERFIGVAISAGTAELPPGCISALTELHPLAYRLPEPSIAACGGDAGELVREISGEHSSVKAVARHAAERADCVD